MRLLVLTLIGVFIGITTLLGVTPMATPVPAPTTLGSSVQGGAWTYQFDPRGGVAYFHGGVPVTNAQYAQATGSDTNSLEQYAKEQFSSPSATPNPSYQAPILGPAQPVAGPPVPTAFADVTAPVADAGTGNTPAAAGVPGFNPVSFNGTIYSDPAALDAARRSYLDTSNRTQLSALDRALATATGFSDPSKITDINAVAADSTLGRSKSSLLKQVSDLLDSYAKGENTAQGNLNSYYSGLGDAYQSSQGVRQAETTDQYAKARADANTQQTEGLAGLQRTLSDYLNQDSTNRTNLAQNYVGAIDSAQNSSTSDLSTALGRNVTPSDLSYAAPTATAAATNDNSSLVGALQKAASGTFKLQNPNGTNDTSSILKYLYGA